VGLNTRAEGVKGENGHWVSRCKASEIQRYMRQNAGSKIRSECQGRVTGDKFKRQCETCP